MDLHPTPDVIVRLDDSDGPCDVVDALAARVFASGAQPWAQTRRLSRVRPDVTFVPQGCTPSFHARDNDRISSLVEGEGWTLWVVRWDRRTATVTVLAESEALAASVLEQVVAGATEDPDPEDQRVELGFWHMGRGPDRRSRKVTSPPWADIRPNYNAGVAASFDRLVAQDPEAITGRIVLLHGPPGTGKTSALRTLAWEWRRWCQFDYVLDPERLLGDPSYLLAVLHRLAEPSDEDGPDPSDDGDPSASGSASGSARPRWRLLLLEDCDELIRGDAKAGSGQALSRLLNLTDGLLGQGIDLIIAISTNEPLGRLHPAVIRPGRCLAQIEVGPLSNAEARRWLGAVSTVPAGPATLAELYALRGDLAVVEQIDPPVAVGQYL